VAPERRRRLTIGVLVSWLGDGYSTPVLAGILDGVRDRHASVISFVGVAPIGPVPGESTGRSPGNVLYDLVGEHVVDGLVAVSGTLLSGMATEHLAELLGRYGSLPIVSIGIPVAGIPHVRVDNETGLRQVIGHLVTKHGKRRIAFIRGPRGNQEAEQRFAVYREVLAEHQIAFADRYVVEGAFNTPSGRMAAEVLLERGVEFDAVVAANDEMALGAIETLEQRGYRVPRRVAVVGFDDTDMAKFASPALTTVRQPLYELGRRASEMLLAKLDGQAVASDVILATEPVIRESCGCSARSALELGASIPPASVELAPIEAQRAHIVGELRRSSPEGAGTSDWPERLAQALVEHCRGDGSALLESLESLVKEASRRGIEIIEWQDIVSILRRHAAASGAEGPHTIWDHARMLVAQGAERVQAQRWLRAEQRSRTASEISRSLMLAAEVEQIAKVLGPGLPSLDVVGCYVALHENPDDPMEWSRLVAWCDENGEQRVGPSSARFRTRDLAPPEVLPDRPVHFVLQTLEHREYQAGFFLIEVGVRRGTFYDELRQQLSSALFRIERAKELARLHAAEQERSRQLLAAHRTLQENQDKLLIAEKMAALGRVTAGIAHEMNTPVAAVRAALDELDKLAQEYGEAAEDPHMSADTHREIAGEMREAIRLGTNAAVKLAGFVRGIKSETANLGDAGRGRFDAVQVIRDTLVTLASAARQASCNLSFEPEGPSILVDGPPDRFARVVANLVSNAIDASQTKGGGPIKIVLFESHGGVELTVTDEGTGIPDEIVSKIFDPMFSTKPFGEATGLGLSVVHDIVRGDFDGTIEVKTKVGEGTTFVLCFRDRDSPKSPSVRPGPKPA
jgi:DNA-binding LacI/PurR family transcriptional regulator/signal transduction histidine kinase